MNLLQISSMPIIFQILVQQHRTKQLKILPSWSLSFRADESGERKQKIQPYVE
jgi:hypothetical protein